MLEVLGAIAGGAPAARGGAGRVPGEGAGRRAPGAANTPAAFKEALRRAKTVVEQPGRQRVVTLNAWNEWTEGSYLLPDRTHGTAHLEALREVFGAGS